ncbi:hypothetical protein BDR26DRAFT_871921 [Obelidium mucronatum]|nr:hypothetical protein BDR26DRAFT_871921 [Obelidium mucronatum]
MSLEDGDDLKTDSIALANTELFRLLQAISILIHDKLSACILGFYVLWIAWVSMISSLSCTIWRLLATVPQEFISATSNAKMSISLCSRSTMSGIAVILAVLSTPTVAFAATSTYLPVPTQPACPEGQRYICGSCTYVDTRDCRGVCIGLLDVPTHVIDCTGSCVPIHSALSYDSCGICGGVSNTCLDCAGVVNGTSSLDYCGICNGNGTTCGVIWDRIEPTVIPNNGQAIVTVLSVLVGNLTSTVTVVSSQQIQIRVDRVLPLNSTMKLVFLLKISRNGAENALFALTVFSMDSRVTSVAPTKVYTQVETLLTISGQNFLTGYPIECMFSAPAIIRTPAIVVNSSAIQCSTPKLQTSMLVNMIVSYKLPSVVKSWRSDLALPSPSSSANITFIAHTVAPVMISSRFAPDGGSIIIQFDKPVGTSPVSNLQIYPLRMLPVVIINSQMVVKPGVGSTVSFLPSKLFSSGSLYSDFVVGNSVILAPQNPLVPSVVVLAPVTIAACQDLLLDLSLISNSGGRPFVFGAVSYSHPSGESTALMDNALQTQLNSQLNLFLSGTQQYLKIPSNNLAPTTHTFNATFQNFLGGKWNRILPNIQIIGPVGPVAIDGVISLQTVVQESCGNASAIIPSLQWSFYSGPVGFEYWISPNEASLDIISFPPFTLPTEWKLYILSLLMDSSVSWVSGSDVFRYQWSCVLEMSYLLPAPNEYFVYYRVSNVDSGASGTSLPVSVSLINDVIPAVTLTLNTQYVSPYSESIIFSSKVVPTRSTISMSSLRYKWFSIPSCGLSKIHCVNTIWTTSSTSQLKIKTWSFSPGGSYCVGVNVWEPWRQRPGNATLHFSVLNGPRGGSCTALTLTIGKAFSTAFKFQCIGWITDTVALPLTYSWELRPASSLSSWTLISAGISPLFQSTFPPGQYILRVNVTDEYQGRNQIPQQISLNVLNYGGSGKLKRDDDAQLEKRLSSSINGYASSLEYFRNYVVPLYQNYSSTSTALTQCSLLVQNVPGSTASAQIKSTLQNEIGAFIDRIAISGIYIDDMNFGPVLLTLIESLATPWAISGTAPVALLAKTLSSVLQKIYHNTAMQTGECLDSELATKALETISSFISQLPTGASNEAISLHISNCLLYLDPCIQKTIACGQPPVLLSTDSFYREVGVNPITSNMTFCGDLLSLDASLISSLNSTANGCVSYSCGRFGKFASSLLGSTVQGIILSENAMDLSIRTTPSIAALNVTFNTFDDGNRYDATDPRLYPYIVRVPIDSKIANMVQSSDFQMKCALVSKNASNAVPLPTIRSFWNISACILESFGSEYGYCKCSSLGTVTLSVVKKTASNTPSTSTGKGPGTDTTDPAANNQQNLLPIILGSSIGGVCVLGLIVFLVCQQGKSRKKQKLVNNLNNIVLPSSKPNLNIQSRARDAKKQEQDEEDDDGSDREQVTQGSHSISSRSSSVTTLETIHIPVPMDSPPPGLARLDSILGAGSLHTLMNPNTLSVHSLNADMDHTIIDPDTSTDSFGKSSRRIYPENAVSSLRRNVGSAGRAAKWPFNI